MKNFGRLILASVVLFAIFSINQTNAQLNAGSFGVGASFVGNNVLATGHYALARNIELAVALGYNSESLDSDIKDYKAPDSKTTLQFNVMGEYFLMKGKDVSPYVGALLGYTSYPLDESIPDYELSSSNLRFAALFGGQVFLAKQFAVFGHIALGYSSYTDSYETTTSGDDYTYTRTILSLGGSAVGAIFFF